MWDEKRLRLWVKHGGFLPVLALLLLPLAQMSCADESGERSQADVHLRPVFIDWTCFDDKGVSYRPPLPTRTPVVGVRNGIELTRSWTEIRKNLGPHQRNTHLKLIHGIPVIIANTGQEKSNMDVLVSIDVQQVSTWDAIKAVTRQVECNLVYGKRMRIFVLPGPGPLPPEAFHAVKSVTLHVTEVPARNALCAILRQAPLDIGIRYSAVREPVLGIKKGYGSFEVRFYEDGKEMNLTNRTPKADTPNWTEEMKEAETPAEDCAARRRNLATAS